MVKNFTADSLKSLIGNLGDPARDKRAGVYYAPAMYTPDMLLNAYLVSWACKKVIDIPASDAISEWRDYKGDGAIIEKVEEFEATIGYQIKIEEALIKARLFGGGCLYIGTGDVDLSLPLDVERAKLKYLTPLSSVQISAGETDYDPTSEFFGKPKSYTINNLTIHPSRFVIFEGIKHPEPQFNVFHNYGWGVSVLQPVLDAIKNADSSQMNIASLLFEMNVDVIKSPDFLEGVANAEYEKRMSSRLTFGAAMKGINGMLLLDGDEEYERKTVSLSQTPELIDKFLDVVCGSADIPRTRFMGSSPGGLNSTGEGDLRNYYDSIATFQRLRLTPALQRLDEIMFKTALGGKRPADFYYEWSPLWKLSDKEKAEINKMTAEATDKYYNMGIIKTEPFAKAVVNRLIEDGTYPGLESTDAATMDEIEEWNTPAVDPNKQQNDPQKIIAGDMAPCGLYVSRKVMNADEILRWAQSVGLDQGLPTSADDLHVTVLYSRQPVDWFKMGESWTAELKLPAGGPRLVEQFGAHVVLRFTSFELQWRHDSMVRAGASEDFPEYSPHITITKMLPLPGFDVEQITPYTGEIILGPEIFESLKDD